MAFDFPTAPVLDDAYTDPVTGATYKYDGEKWASGGGGATLPPAADVYLPLAGGTMAGAIQLPATQPLALTESTHKQYVDTAIAAKALYQGVWQVAANSPDITPATANPLHSYSWIANTVDPNLPETAPAALPGIGGLLISSSDTVIWNETLAAYELVRSPASVSGDFVETTGDTMTGALIAPSVEITAGAVSTVRMFPSASPNGGRIDFQTADGSVRKGYIGYGGDNVLMLHAETGKQWQARGGFNVATGDLNVAGHATVGGNLTTTGNHYITSGIAVTGGSTLTGAVTMGGNLNITGSINPSSVTQIGHIQSSSHIEAVQNVYANSLIVNTTGRNVVDEIDKLKALIDALTARIKRFEDL